MRLPPESPDEPDDEFDDYGTAGFTPGSPEYAILLAMSIVLTLAAARFLVGW